MKLKHIIIGIILIIILIFSNVFYKNITTNKSETKNTYFNGSVQFMKKKKAKKKKTKKKVKKSKKKAKKKKVIKYKSVATASKNTYYQYAKSFGGYDDTQMSCLINLWQRESGWNPNAKNKKSGACGIPQALPCSKIKKQQGSNNWDAQIRWGINYVNYKYKSPCNAWNNFKRKGWY